MSKIDSFLYTPLPFRLKIVGVPFGVVAYHSCLAHFGSAESEMVRLIIREIIFAV